MTNTSDPAVVEAMRQAIRDAVFTTKPRSKVISVFGTEIEIRQPSLRAILGKGFNELSPDVKAAHVLIGYAYVPGTNQKVFEDLDVDGILGLPFGEDMNLIQNTIGELTDVEKMTKAAEGNSETTE
jgi:hypothetical protein